ncbi:MAG TPA: hypothetical protein VNJ52_12665 [Patescibacteria group bacterium]|nr:hypothetical protein [Patescibacteria group bacterium]
MTLARKLTKRGTRQSAPGRRVRRRKPASPRRKAQNVSRAAAHPEPPTVLYRACKSGWAVLTEKVPSAPHTRFVCPFCPRSHRVPGPVRGFRRVRRPQWLKLCRVFE